MIASILSWVAGGGLSGIARELRQAYQDKLQAANDKERIAADERINRLEAQKETILAAQRDNVERWVRVGFALPFIIYNAKLVVYDKVLGWGVTDPLSEHLTYIEMTVLSGYFLLFTAKAIRK